MFPWFISLFLIFIWGDVSARATSLESLLPKDPPQGWALIEGPKLFTRKTLFEHLDGQAELYFKYGYQKSIFASYQHQERPEDQMEIDIFDMGNILQAFGIFSRLRTEDRSGGIGLDSSFDNRSILFYKAKYFVMLYGTESDPSTMKELAVLVSSRISDASPAPKEINFFPSRGLKPGSIQYFSEGLLGHRFLKGGFQATYREGAKESNLFLGQFKNSGEARAALKTYKDYLTQKGKIQSGIRGGLGPHALRGEDPYQGKVLVVQTGSHLVGMVGFENEKGAEDCLSEMIRNVMK